MLIEGIFSLLTGEASISALVGTRIFPVQAPEAATTPHIVYSQISGDGNPELEGAGTLHQARIQFSVYATRALEAKRIQTALRRFLEGWRGVLSEGTEVDVVTLNWEGDNFEEEVALYHAPIDFEFVYRDVGT